MHGDETHELPISMVSTFVTASLSIGALQEGSVRTESISSGPPPTASRPQNILQEISMVLYDGFYPLISLGAQSFAQSSTIVFGSLPSKAISWMRVNSGNSASSFLCLSTVITSLDVMVPWSFWPLSLDFSISSHEPSPLAKASAHARLRPPKQVVTRSASPQLSMKVSSCTPLKKSLANLAVSLRPMRMMAAFVLPPKPRPSQKPAPRATTFLRAPQSSTPATSLILPTRNVGQSKSFCQTMPASSLAKPTVDSQNWSAATSLATLAPMSTEVSIPPIESLMILEMSLGPPSSNSMPLMSEMALQSWPRRASRSLSNFRNWWGVTKIRSVAPSTAVMISGSATTFSVNLWPLRYLTFSCFSLMISVRFLPSTCSW
mmetsp:Transcript_1575/g.2304  ORF Transcript_1575/g.2304 Transcript_1575/m.2304 type:complete len:376 (-) Transcript_1575:224-1351(-)